MVEDVFADGEDHQDELDMYMIQTDQLPEDEDPLYQNFDEEMRRMFGQDLSELELEL
jgi:hypothetical protein